MVSICLSDKQGRAGQGRGGYACISKLLSSSSAGQGKAGRGRGRAR